MVKRVMIVDDESMVRYTVKHGLEGLDPDFEVIDIDSGKKCFEYLEKKGIPDIILLDIMMPEMNGWEVQKRLKDKEGWRSIPVLFMTGVEDPTSKRLSGLIACGLIEKPVKIPELKQRIDKILHM